MPPASTLTLSLGNTSLFGGVFTNSGRTALFRIPSPAAPARDDLEPALRRRVRGRIDRAVLCSVVPSETQALVRLVGRAFGVHPLLLTADADHGVTIGYRRPGELGTDRLAAAMGARVLYPKKNVIVVDCGTATTVTALRADATLAGGAIFPGLALWPELLAMRTAQLPAIAVGRPPARVLGRSTREALAGGMFFGHAGAIREVVRRVRSEAFGPARAVVIGTGGHAPHFARENLFTVHVPDLILIGLRDYAERCF